MAAPSPFHKHEGTWGCNGEYVWWAYSDGAAEDPHANDHTRIDMRRKEYKAIQGSSEMYAFMAHRKQDTQLQCRFVMCFCEP